MKDANQIFEEWVDKNYEGDIEKVAQDNKRVEIKYNKKTYVYFAFDYDEDIDFLNYRYCEYTEKQANQNKVVEDAIRKAIESLESSEIGRSDDIPVEEIKGVCEKGMWAVEISKMSDGEYWFKLRVAWDFDKEAEFFEDEINDGIIKSIANDFRETITDRMADKQYAAYFEDSARF